MSRLQTVRENWTDITTKLLRDKQELANFLRFSASMYKQSFSDAVLIYQQNPNATKVATLETWNKLGRLVYYPLFQFIHFDASRHSKLKASKVSRGEAKVI